MRTIVVCTCGEDVVVRTSLLLFVTLFSFYKSFCLYFKGENSPFLGWAYPLMCLRVVDIIPGLLRSRNQMEHLLDMTEEIDDFDEHRANTQEIRENMEQRRANVEHEKANREHSMANRMRTYLMLSWFVFVGYLFLHQ
nr:hypothetical protein [Tanacetum cinerariifolium]